MYLASLASERILEQKPRRRKNPGLASVEHILPFSLLLFLLPPHEKFKS